MFAYWKKLDASQHVIKALWVVIGLLLLLAILFFWGWKTAPQRMTVYIPPDISTGVSEKPDSIPKADVYAFAFQIFSALNTWSFDGDKDYKAAIDNYRYYLTTPFYNALQTDYQQRQQSGALERTRIMTGYSGMGYTDNSVTVLAPNTWQVDLKMHVVERVGNTVVKDVLIDYPLRIVKIDMSIALNPWGLAIDGFDAQPTRLKTLI